MCARGAKWGLLGRWMVGMERGGGVGAFAGAGFGGDVWFEVAMQKKCFSLSVCLSLSLFFLPILPSPFFFAPPTGVGMVVVGGGGASSVEF